MHTSEFDQQEDGAVVEDISLSIDSIQAGNRLDLLLVQLLPESSRSRITSSIRSGLIRVNGEQSKASYKLKAGERVSGTLFEPPPLLVVPEKIDFPIVFEDDYLIILSKPPGLVVHPGSGNSSGTLVNGLVHYCDTLAEVGDSIRPGIVHRLDKDTSGIMVVAKDDHIHRQLVEIFKDRKVEKEYIAVVHGILPRQEGRIVAPIGRHQVNRKKMAVQEISGKYAASSWHVIEEIGARYSKIRVKIETGRTHQIRVHMAHLGYPVAGDALYGPNKNNKPFPRQMLHAKKLSFVHPMTQKKNTFHAPIWADMKDICEQLSHDG